MKKYIGYIVILVFGLLFGYLTSKSLSEEKTTHNIVKTDQKNEMWTCSMHPQIMQPEAGDCPICGMDLIPAETSADGLNVNEFKLSKNAMALANIQTTVIDNTMNTDNTIKLSGKINENENANVVQASYFSGRIERLYISSIGQKVSKGQLLATIYSPELFSAQQELITVSLLKKSQPVLYKAVRNKLKLWKISDSQIDKIEASKKVTQNIPIYATVSGTVSEKLVAQGDYVKQGQAILKISNLNSVWAVFDVYENQIDLLKKGQNITVTTNAHPNKKIKKKVDFINPTMNSVTRTVNLRVVLNNKNQEFKTGMFVEGVVKNLALNAKNIVTVPASAVLWTGKRAVVYLKTMPNQSVFELQEVTLGKQFGNQYQVLDGIKSGDEIVTNGTFTVDAAAQLQGKKSMMNKTGGKVMTGHEGHLMNHKNTELDQSTTNKRLLVAVTFQNQLKKVFNNYIKLKEALTKDDVKLVATNATDMLNSLSEINMKLLTDKNAHHKWMKISKKLNSISISISVNYNIEKQRSYFKSLSLSLINAIEIFGVNEKVYSQFCPMVNDNNGAYWLSKEKKVVNPYFGGGMLKCGSVKKTIE
ncbi:efflux RND transporter periplasmic adaptor subunit [Tenacibaculum insulae]|uniref:efflux RND transporter periplasmic adaptor subunit n=1 Tax=Tenacibaculum insulae TaxID=2029677 RepID=UPI003AB2690F